MNLKKLIILPALLIGAGLWAQDSRTIKPVPVKVTATKDTASKKPAPKKTMTYKDIITKEAITKKGMFTVHQVGDKFYFEIPDAMLGREILVTTRLMKVPTGSPKYPGEIVNTKTIAFSKGPNKNLFVKVITHVNLVNPNDRIARAVENASEDPIVSSFDVKANGPDSTTSVIDVTDYFKNDNAIVGFDQSAKRTMKLGGIAADRTFIESMQPYPKNIEIEAMKTFSMGGGAPAPAGDAPASPSVSAPSEGGYLTLTTATSLMLLPKVPMQPRYSDPRVGYFSDSFNVFSDRQQQVDIRSIIVRFRMEPKQGEMENYLKGKLVEPEKPIVFYVDPAMPRQWQPYVIAGINAWQKAFEQAGFKNAIIGKAWPTDKPNMEIGDARNFVVRYFPSAIQNAEGREVHDPRSGEILQAYVGLHMSILRLLHNWYMLQAGATDPKARSMKFDDQTMGKLVQSVITHEIGHTLGLMHNMGASSMVPVEKLRDKKWVDANGISPSIMDYARFNYVAQPGDQMDQNALIAKLGVYDKWAIEWGYRFTGIKDPEKESKLNEQLVSKMLKKNPALWFGGNGKNNDPRAQSEDLGDNNVTANEYGMKNLKFVTAHLEQWTREPNRTYDDLEDMYDKVAGQYKTFYTTVAGNIGGVYETVRTSDDHQAMEQIVPKARQKAAMDFMNKEIFATPTWALDPEMLNKFRTPGKQELMSKMQEGALYLLLSTSKFNQLIINEKRFGADKAYTLDEMLTDLEGGLFSELNSGQPTDLSRRTLQKRYVQFVGKILQLQGKLADVKSGIADYSATDMPALLIAHLTNLKVRLDKTVAKNAMDKAHFSYLSARIASDLNQNN